MTRKLYRIPLLDLLFALSTAVDLVSSAVGEHHKRVAYIALRLAQQLGLPLKAQHDVLMAGLLHDIGAFSQKERLDLLQFEVEDAGLHCEVGYLFLSRFAPFTTIAEMVRFHHTPWRNGAGSECNGNVVPQGSHILHLADRIEVLIDRKEHPLRQAHFIMRRIEPQAGVMFADEMVQAFIELGRQEYFWLDAVSPSLELIMASEVNLGSIELDLDGLTDLAKMFCQLIDFKSPFTATHSSGVAASAAKLAELSGFSTGEQQLIEIAGYLHDLGKLAVPSEILEKPAQLTAEEFSVMQSHAYYSRRILELIDDFSVIAAWGSAHHERLDGGGYPFHEPAERLPLGARICAAADVFTALCEDRPYREGMARPEVRAILTDMGAEGKLDPRVVTLLNGNFDVVDTARSVAQEAATAEYAAFAEAAVPCGEGGE